MNTIKQLKPVYQGNTYADFRDMLNKTVANHGNLDAFIVKHMRSRKEFTYQHITFKEFRDDIYALGEGLLTEEAQGKKIAIIGANCYRWLISYFAVLGGLGTCVPLDKGLPYEELKLSLLRSGADILIFDAAHKEDVERLRTEEKVQVTSYICMEEVEGYRSVPDYMEIGRKRMADAGAAGYSALSINPEETSILLFTSGTTSLAKAVMLSQRNIMSNLEALERVIDIRAGDITMAFLPYHHIFGIVGQLYMTANGVTTTYCDGLKYLQSNLVEYKVSVFFCVPLLIESIYKKVMAAVKKEGKERKVAFGMKLTRFLLKFGIDIRRKVFKEVLDKLGGNIRLVISGASAIDPEALEGFKAFGIVALQGYGMTESSPVICVENAFEQRTGSIGRPLPGVEARIFEPNEDGIGELIARGPNVMQGYYENDEETAKTVVDGWLHTGDLAYTDKDGYVFICGRKKNVIVLKNGKNVYPEELEVLINNLPYVEECMVFGQPRHHDGDHKDLAICVKIVYKPESFDLDAEQIEAHIKEDIGKINETLPTYKQMLRVIVTDQEMIKTTTGKVKRFEESNRL